MSVKFSSLSDPKVIEMLVSGKVGVIPTDTVYGLVCRADDEQSVVRLYGLKDRINNPGPVIASSIDQIAGLGVKKRYLTAVKDFWPNPISIQIPHSIGYLNQGTGRQAFRVVKNEELQKLLNLTGPILTTSANHPKKPGANTIDEAEAYFGNQVDFYVDGGDLSQREASTIIRIVDDAIEVIREGAVKIDEETGRIIE